MKNLRTAYISGAMGFRALFAWNTPGLFVVSLLLTPLLQVAFFVLLGVAFGYQNPIFFIVGNSIQAVAAAGIFGMVSVIANERRLGTLSLVLGSPGSRTAVFLGRMLPGVVLGFMVTVFTSGVGLTLVQLFGGRGTWKLGSNLLSGGGAGGHLALYLAAVAAAAFSCAALGLALSALGLIYRDIFQIATAVGLLLLVVSGANLLRASFPLWLQWLGNILPTTHSIDAARTIVAGTGADMSLLALSSIGWELLVGVAWVTIALLGMRLLERRAKRQATLNIY